MASGVNIITAQERVINAEVHRLRATINRNAVYISALEEEVRKLRHKLGYEEGPIILP